MNRYRITLASPQVYVVDTDEMVYWPEGHSDSKSPLIFPRMNPEDPEFAGKLLDADLQCPPDTSCKP